MQDFLQLVLVGLGTGSIYALIALGFVLIYKCSGILNMAQGHFVMLGAYLGYAFAGQFHLPWWISIVLVLLSIGLLAMALERFTLRPLIGQPLLAQILMTLGLASILQGATVTIWGVDIQKAPSIFPSGGLDILGAILSWENAFAIILAAFLVVVFALFFKYARIGLRMRAVADDAVAAQSLGTRLARVYQVSWIVSALVAALGGTILGSIAGVSGQVVDLGLKSIVVVLFGGLESIYGVVLAGPILGLIEAFASQYLDPYVGGGIKEVASFAILIPMLVILPYGLFGWKRIDRV